jgi:hypothetical protein
MFGCLFLQFSDEEEDKVQPELEDEMLGSQHDEHQHKESREEKVIFL